jgi:hypothetical protein
MAITGRHSWLDFAAPTTAGFVCRTSGHGFEWDSGGNDDGEDGGSGSGGGRGAGSGGVGSYGGQDGDGGRGGVESTHLERRSRPWWFACAAAGHHSSGFYALSVAPQLRGLVHWGASSPSSPSVAESLQLLVREEPTVRGVYPSAVAAAAGHVNRPLTVTGSNFPGGGGQHGGEGLHTLNDTLRDPKH